MYLINLYKELRIWWKVRIVAKENEKLLEEKGFRVDWIGRIYTVINLPDEIVTSAMDNESYVFMKIKDYTPIFLDIGIADYVSPEISEIPDSYAYLLIICPDRNYFRLWEIVKFLFKAFLLGVLARILYIIFTLDAVSNFFINLFNLFVNGN